MARKNITEVIGAFQARKALAVHPCFTDGATIHSYGMAIAGRNPDGSIWIASSKDSPSQTTSAHIKAVRLAIGSDTPRPMLADLSS